MVIVVNTRFVKRHETVDLFRQRLLSVIERSGLTRSAFAAKTKIDRSTLSQLLSTENDRLPRVETLAAIALSEQVSVDWLIGLSQEGRVGADILRQSVEVEPDADIPGAADARLERWHAEAAGYKVRYVPTTLPDLLKTDRIIQYEYRRFAAVDPAESKKLSLAKLDLQRRSGSEMEVCNSVQAIQGFARGEGIWRELTAAARKEQLEHMLKLVDELYPSFRWFLYDSRNRYSVPLTVFGPKRAVVYVGQMYWVFNSLEHIRVLTRHFEDLIRAAVIQPHEFSPFLKASRGDVSLRAVLPMYDLPEVRGATDAVWERLARHLGDAGVANVPRRLSRDIPFDALGTASGLLFAQTCGYPLTHADRGRFRVLATPCYRAPGCHGPTYSSAIIVGELVQADALGDLSGKVCAVNGLDSHSGMNALFAEVAKVVPEAPPEPPFFERIVLTGSHSESVGAVARGDCDVAAIDAVTYALLARWRPAALERTRLLSWTDAAPAPPFVTSAHTPLELVARLDAALDRLFDDPHAREPLADLLLSRIVRLPLSDYDQIVTMEARRLRP